MKKCIFRNCTNTSTNSSAHFFPFPCTINFAHKWLDACNRPDLKHLKVKSLSNRYEVCSMHFELLDYKNIVSPCNFKLKIGVIPKQLSKAHDPLSYSKYIDEYLATPGSLKLPMEAIPNSNSTTVNQSTSSMLDCKSTTGICTSNLKRQPDMPILESVTKKVKLETKEKNVIDFEEHVILEAVKPPAEAVKPPAETVKPPAKTVKPPAEDVKPSAEAVKHPVKVPDNEFSLKECKLLYGRPSEMRNQNVEISNAPPITEGGDENLPVMLCTQRSKKRKTYNRPNRKYRRLHLDEVLAFISPLIGKVLTALIKRKIVIKRTPKARFGPFMKNLSIALFFRMNYAKYAFLAQLLPIAKTSTVEMWLRNIRCTPGINEDVCNILKLKIGNEKSKSLSVLLLDEISLRPNLDYEEKSDQVLGFDTTKAGKAAIIKDSENFMIENEGSLEKIENPSCVNTKNLANSAVFFMLHGLSSSWKMPIGYSLCSSKIEANEWIKELNSYIAKIEECGLTVSAISSVLDSKFSKFARQLCVTNDESAIFVERNREIVAIKDVTSLNKSSEGGLLEASTDKTAIDLNSAEKSSLKHLQKLYLKNISLKNRATDDEQDDFFFRIHQIHKDPSTRDFIKGIKKIAFDPLVSHVSSEAICEQRQSTEWLKIDEFLDSIKYTPQPIETILIKWDDQDKRFQVGMRCQNFVDSNSTSSNKKSLISRLLPFHLKQTNVALKDCQICKAIDEEEKIELHFQQTSSDLHKTIEFRYSSVAFTEFLLESDQCFNYIFNKYIGFPKIRRRITAFMYYKVKNTAPNFCCKEVKYFVYDNYARLKLHEAFSIVNSQFNAEKDKKVKRKNGKQIVT